MKIIHAQVFDPELGFLTRDVCFQGSLLTPVSTDWEVYDAAGCYVIPGLTDLHFHGCRGADFSDGDGAGLRTMAEYELSRGVTQICPAGMTLEEDALAAACRTAAEYHASGTNGAELVGINLEGPFLSEAKKGGQNGAWLRAPDIRLFRRLNQASGGLVRLVSVAPELPGAMEFIRQASGDAVVSLAHTQSDYDTAMEAFRQGAKQVTHLFNAMEPFLHRAPGVVGAALDSPDCRVELICDGIHIHPSVVRAVFRMFGADRVILVSDSMRATGMPDGEYMLGGQEVTVRGARATLPDGTLAGSATDLMRCLRNAVSFGIPLADAVRAACVNPAKVLGIYHRVGSLEPGKEARLAILNPNLSLKAVFFQGVPVPVS